VIVSLAIILVLLGAAAALGAGSGWLGRRIPNAALAGFLVLSVLPDVRAFVSNTTPLPLDHVTFTRPWHTEGGGAPYNPYLNDITTQVLPWTEAARLALEDRSLPLRDRWNGCGTPLAANSVSAAFWPLNAFAYLLPLARAFTLIGALKLLLAACGMWLWVREIGASPRAAGFAGASFALSFTFVPPWIFYPQSGVFCLWPWALFLVERCRATEGRGRAFAALTGIFMLSVLAGHPESSAMGYCFAGLWLLARWILGELPDLPRLARTIAASAAIAAALTAFLLLPSLAAIAASGRLAAAARPYWQPHLSLLPHAPLWAGILPGFFPHSLGNSIRSPAVPGATGTFCEMAMGYAGILCWAAALLVLRPGSGRPRSERVLWGLALCGFGVAVCLWPLAEIFAHVPALRYVFPLRFNGWVALALPAIAAFELDRYARDVREGRGNPLAAVAVPAVLALCAAGLYAFLFGLRRATGGLRFQTWQLGLVLAVLGLAALLALASRERPGRYVLGLTVLCAAELTVQWHILNRLYSPDLLFPETPLLAYLHRQPGTFRVAGKGPVLFPSTNVFARLEDIRTHDAVERRDYMAFLDRTCGYPYEDYFKMLRNVDAPALDFLNVRFLLAEPRAPLPGARWREVYSGADGTVFENLRVLPRAFAPARVRRIPPPAKRPWPVFDAAAAFGPAFADVVALEDWGGTAYVLTEGAGDALENPPVEVSRYTESTNAAAFEARVAEGGEPGFVVLSLVQDGGWSARDETGRSIPAFLANGPFLALRIPPGRHRVALDYCPPGFRLGSAISLAALAVLAAAALVRRGRGRAR